MHPILKDLARALIALVIVLAVISTLAQLAGCGGGSTEPLSPFEQCLAEFVGPLRPGEVPAHCRGLEGDPAPQQPTPVTDCTSAPAVCQ